MSEDKVEMAAIYRLHSEIKCASERERTITVRRDDLIDALRMIEILQSEVRELVGGKHET